MSNTNPQLPLQQQEQMIEWLSLFLLIAMCLYAIMKFGYLPDSVPNHFNALGEPDSWGSKGVVFLGPGIALATYLLFYFISKMSPDTYNHPVKITEENKDYQYALSRIMLKVINLWTMVLMAFITWAIIEEAGGKRGAMNPVVLWTIIGSFGLVMVVYIYLARKAR
jgi:uncharacterized membrane protein